MENVVSFISNFKKKNKNQRKIYLKIKINAHSKR